jgi:hypothetical protein
MIVSLIRPYSSHTKTKTKRSCFYRLLGDPNSFIYVLTAGIKLFGGSLANCNCKGDQKTFVLREKYCWLVADKSNEQGV